MQCSPVDIVTSHVFFSRLYHFSPQVSVPKMELLLISYNVRLISGKYRLPKAILKVTVLPAFLSKSVTFRNRGWLGATQLAPASYK